MIHIGVENIGVCERNKQTKRGNGGGLINQLVMCSHQIDSLMINQELPSFAIVKVPLSQMSIV